MYLSILVLIKYCNAMQIQIGDMMKQIVVRIDDDLYNKLETKADMYKTTKSKLVRGILNGHNGKDIKIINEIKKSTINYKKMVKMKKKLLNDFKEFIMEYMNDTDMHYVTKEDTDIIEQFKKELKENLDNIKEKGSIYEYDNAKEIYYAFIKKDIYLTRKLIDYPVRRIKWIIRGKIIPTMKEAKAIEEYIKEKSKDSD